MTDSFAYIKDPTARTLTLALEQCMKTKSIDQIHTSDILKVSGVSRTTFYRRYRDKYDMVNRNYQYLLDETMNQIAGGKSYAEVVRAIYGALLTNPSFYKNALSSTQPDSLRQYIFRYSYDNHAGLLKKCGIDMHNEINRMLLTGFISGVLTITVIWAERGMRETPDELLDCFYELMPDIFRKCFFVRFV